MTLGSCTLPPEMHYIAIDLSFLSLVAFQKTFRSDRKGRPIIEAFGTRDMI